MYKQKELKTLLLGASLNPYSYAFMAAKRLYEKGYEFIPMSNKPGTIFGQEILDINTKPTLHNIHTIAVYLNPEKQREWYDYLLSIQPQRVIFNPGAENPDFSQMAKVQGIEVENSCILTLLSIGNYSPSFNVK